MDVMIMICFGLVGYMMKKFEFDAAPLMLAYVLGPMLERSLRQSLILSDGSLGVFVSRPISMILLLIAMLSLFMPLIRVGFRQLTHGLMKESLRRERR